MQSHVTTAFIVLVGFCLGSFLNVCIHRIPQKVSVVRGRSRCPSCHHLLSWRHLAPLVSFLLLRGRCAFCGARIALRYPAVEALTALILTALVARLGLSSELVIYAPLVLLLLVVAAIDLDTLTIPNSLLLFGVAIWLLAVAVSLAALWPGVVGGLVGGGLLLMAAALGHFLFRGESMGMGDVKLAAMMGLFLGPAGVGAALAIAVFLGGAVGIVGLATGALGRHSKLPFGVFLAGGSLVCLMGQPEQRELARDFLYMLL